MPRYVVLRHELPPDNPRGSHWDLMLEFAGALRTWALPVEPCAGQVQTAEALSDHRLAYLDYEGPVSEGRGAVSRWDQGTFETEEQSDTRWQCVLSGRRLKGELVLAKQKGGHFWSVSFGAAPTTG